jgi:hypothetical protein
MATQPARKCRCASDTHGHDPGKCANLATQPDSLCKLCYDTTLEEVKERLEELKDITATSQKDERKEGRKHRSA